MVDKEQITHMKGPNKPIARALAKREADVVGLGRIGTAAI